MNKRYLSIVQTALLASAMVAGFLLKNDLSGGPRLVHRLLGMLAGLVGLAVIFLLFKKGSTTPQKIFSITATILGFVAGYAGMSLSGAGNYDMFFGLMRASGVLSLVSATIASTLMSKKS